MYSIDFHETRVAWKRISFIYCWRWSCGIWNSYSKILAGVLQKKFVLIFQTILGIIILSCSLFTRKSDHRAPQSNIWANLLHYDSHFLDEVCNTSDRWPRVLQVPMTRLPRWLEQLPPSLSSPVMKLRKVSDDISTWRTNLFSQIRVHFNWRNLA